MLIHAHNVYVNIRKGEGELELEVKSNPLLGSSRIGALQVQRECSFAN